MSEPEEEFPTRAQLVALYQIAWDFGSEGALRFIGSLYRERNDDAEIEDDPLYTDPGRTDEPA